MHIYIHTYIHIYWCVHVAQEYIVATPAGASEIKTHDGVLPCASLCELLHDFLVRASNKCGVAFDFSPLFTTEAAGLHTKDVKHALHMLSPISSTASMGSYITVTF